MNAREVLVKGARELGVELLPETVELFMRYLEYLKFWNKKINLTSVREDHKIVINHFLDSITVLSLIDRNSKVLDVGSGAGFPGIPLKLVEPSLIVTLMDSVHKKVVFMRYVIRELGLKGIEAVWARAEDPKNGIPRGYFDFVVSRALGKIEEVLEVCSPYIVEKKGRIILMRGKRGLDEWKALDDSICRDYRLEEVKHVTLPFGKQQRIVLSVSHG